MAYNFRPKNIEDIISLKYPKQKEKQIISLYDSLSRIAGTNEVMTMDIKLKKVKILRNLKSKVDIQLLKKKYVGVITDFGNGSVPKNANAMGKALADAGELATVKSLFSDVNNALDTGQKLFIDNPNFFDNWKETFLYTRPAVKKITKYPIQSYDIVHDATDKSQFTKTISTFTRQIGKTNDSWNPADIYLIKKSDRVMITKSLKEITDKRDLDRKMRTALFNTKIYRFYKEGILYPISLKQLKTSSPKIEYTNEPDKDAPELHDIVFEKMTLDFSFDTKEIGRFSFKNKDTGKKIAMQVRGFPHGYRIGQTEITSDGSISGGRLGKVPTKVVDTIMGDYNNERISSINYFGRAAKGYFSEFDKTKIKALAKEYKNVKNHSKVNERDRITDIDKFMEMAVEHSKDDLDFAEKFAMKIQGLRIMDFFVSNEKDVKYIMNELINGAKKISTDNGFFIKIS